MTGSDREREEEPIEPGWYAYSGGSQVMIFHLRETGQWSVHLDNGTASDCAWGYIEQALGVWDLVPLHPAHDKAVAAKALQDAADRWTQGARAAVAWADWLRDRAAQIEADDA